MKPTSHPVLEEVVAFSETSQASSEPLFCKESLAKRDGVVIIRGYIKISP